MVIHWETRRHGKLLEEGASGYLGKKLANNEDKEAITENGEVEWSSFNKLFSDRPNEDRVSFGSKHWASVYLASTPQQAAIMGLKFPGVDEVIKLCFRSFDSLMVCCCLLIWIPARVGRKSTFLKEMKTVIEC